MDSGKYYFVIYRNIITNKKEGFGKENESQIDSFYGFFKNGQKNGFGKLTYNRGEKYIGGFKMGLKHGLGVLISIGSRIYAEWCNDKADGEGFMTNSTGKLQH